jgi:hypothetical protein
MPPLADLKMYSRFAFGLRSFLRNPITLEQAAGLVQKQHDDREANFLRLLQRGVFGYPKSPYLPLLKLADCGLEDIRRMVADRGLEATLEALRAAGVYVTFEECKGRAPIVRDGHVWPVTDHDFDNPYLKPHYTSESGGSTGAGTRVHHELDFLSDLSLPYMLAHQAHGVFDAPTAIWRGILPDGSGLNTVLRMARWGRMPEKWYTPVAPRDLAPSQLRFRLATQFAVLISHAVGVPMPRPETVRIPDAHIVARWAAETLERRGACVVNAVASRGLRVALAARDAGLSLRGATFVIAGEPVTPAKVRGITDTGAKHFTDYGFSEGGRLAVGCANPTSSNDLHLSSGISALIQWPRQVPGMDVTVPAFNVTSLLPSAPKILLNAESDDYGVIETRRCGCPLDLPGLSRHIRDIRSFRKLTGEGVTLVGSEILNILEDVLPARFGGSPLDYQLHEEEDKDGLTRLSLIISPRVNLPDEGTVVSAVLEAMTRESVGADAARKIWAQAGTLRIRRAEPIVTGRGKLMPLHVTKRV